MGIARRENREPGMAGQRLQRTPLAPGPPNSIKETPADGQQHYRASIGTRQAVPSSRTMGRVLEWDGGEMLWMAGGEEGIRTLEAAFDRLLP